MKRIITCFMIAAASLSLSLPVRGSGLPLIFDATSGAADIRWTQGENESNTWYQVDFGEVREVSRTETFFADAEKGHAYHLEFSIDGNHWYPGGGRKEVVRQSPHVDEVARLARCLRVRVPRGTSVLQNFKVYGAAPPDVSNLPERAYLFTFFLDRGHSGLHIAWSLDGLTWHVLNKGRSFLESTLVSKLMRDPQLTRGPDGTFHLIWTIPRSPWGIGYSSSKNLVDWSEQRILPVMKSEPTVENCWAPETFYDDATEQFVIIWASTIPGRFPESELPPDHPKKHHADHRHYYVTTKDFITLSEPKLFFDPGYNSIDATLLKRDGQYYMVFKDERIDPVKKNMLAAVGDSATGPFRIISEPFTETWTEGASLIEMGDYVYCYYDMYGAGRYALARSKDMIHWENISKDLTMLRGTRHGSIIEVPRTLLKFLLKVGDGTEPSATRQK